MLCGLRSALFRISSGWLDSEFGSGSASLGSRPDSRSVSGLLFGPAGLEAQLARLSSCLGWVSDSTWLKTPLSARLGSAQIGLNSFGLGRYSRLCSARLEAGLYWLEALLGMARRSVWLGSSIGPARTRLEAQDSARDTVWL